MYLYSFTPFYFSPYIKNGSKEKQIITYLLIHEFNRAEKSAQFFYLHDPNGIRIHAADITYGIVANQYISLVGSFSRPICNGTSRNMPIPALLSRSYINVSSR
jgi:hypothetical protein